MTGNKSVTIAEETYLFDEDDGYVAIYWSYYSPYTAGYNTIEEAVGSLASGADFGELSAVGVVEASTGRIVCQFADEKGPSYFDTVWDAHDVVGKLSAIDVRWAPGPDGGSHHPPG